MVASAFDDSIAFVDTEADRVTSIALGPGLGDAPAERGRRLFFDARLSHDGWMSCHSCHSEGHTNGLLADTLGDDSRGTPKRVLSLLGSRDTAPYAWNGTAPTLEAQIEKTLRHTMHASDADAGTVAALAAFVSTLPAPRPRPSSADVVERGRELFRLSGCTECHVPPLFTSADTYDVGTRDEAGATRFNPPSLRGVGLRAGLFHDGRHGTIEDMLARSGHPRGETLEAQAMAEIAAYLKTL